MSVWVKSLRLSVCILASLLAITSFVLVKTDIYWTAVIAIFFITSTTMLQNDWRDRFHDVHKGKILALSHQRAFLVLLLMFWIISSSLIILTTLHNTGVGVTLGILAVIGLVYSETRMIPFIPITLVSITSASPAILPLVAGFRSDKLFLLFISSVLIIFAREITKDLNDKKIDSGYKWTIPLIFGEQCSRILVAISIVVGFFIATKVSLIILPVTFLAIILAIALIYGVSPSTSRKYLDIGIALVILIIIVFE